MTGSAISGAPGFWRRLFPEMPEVGPETFVLWEPCSRSHGEIVPGYARYLRDLGYEVLVLMTPARLGEGLFSRIDDPGIRHGGLTQRQIRKWMRGPGPVRAAGIMVTTAGKLPERADKSIDLHKVFGADLPRPLVLVEHDARPRVDAGVWRSDSVTLRPLDYRGASSVVVNPHYFGDIKITPKSAGKTVFLAVGAVRSRRGNPALVHQSALRLLEAGHDNFEIRVIGKRGREGLPAALRDHVRVLGRLTFDAMYAEIEAADVILTSFQKDNPGHAFYRTGGTSGSFQLAYGFAKPILVQADFAASAGFDAGNALLYDEDDDMAGAMHAAMSLDAAGYARLQQAMEATADTIYAQSLHNLGARIGD